MHIIAVFTWGEGGYWTIYRNNLENHLLLSGAGLDEYKFIAFCCWLGCILQEGCSCAELRTSFGEKLQIPLGSICQNCLDGVHIFWNAGTGSIKQFKSSVSTCLWGWRFLQEKYARRVSMKYFKNIPGRVWSVCDANSLNIDMSWWVKFKALKEVSGG